jgi:PDZ domain
MKRTTMIGVGIAAALCAGLALRPASRAQTSAAPSQQPAASVRFRFGGDVAQLPAQFIGNLIFLPVKVNRSQPSLFELNSTAAISSVDPRRATELGIANVQGSVLNLSGVDISLPDFAQIADTDFGARVGRTYEGTIGNDVFAGVVMGLDYARQTVRMYDPAGYQYSGRGKSFPLTFHDGMPVIPAKFNVGGHRNVEGEFALNTGLDASVVISDKFAQQHHLFSSHMKTIPVAPGELGVGGSAVIGRIESFQIGEYEVQAPLAAFAQGELPGGGSAQFAGEIGGGFLRRFTVTFDYVRQLVILDSNSEFRTDDREDMSGISVAASGPNLKTFEVTQVRPGTPGSSAGVEKGDVIAGVDEEAAADLTLAALRNLFRQVGHKYKLLIERNGKTLTVNVQMRRLL